MQFLFPNHTKSANTTVRISFICTLSNAFLCCVKFLGGLLAHSEALISDAVNSLFDVLTGAVSVIGAKLSGHPADQDHPYGHERFESVAAIILTMMLVVAALFAGHVSIENLLSGSYLEEPQPGPAALWAAVISIVVKEILFWLTMRAAKKTDSLILKAQAWDHHSDVISTLGALIGIILARKGFAQADPIASLIVCVFILKTAYNTLTEAFEQLVDKSADTATMEQMRQCISEIEGVLRVDMLQVRTFANRLYADVEISEDGNIPLSQAHEVAQKVHDELEQRFPKVKHVMVHVNPMTSNPADSKTRDSETL